MKFAAAFAIALLVQGSCSVLALQLAPAAAQSPVLAVPVYKVNLDENPLTRWSAVAGDYKVYIQQLISAFLTTVPVELRYIADFVTAKLDTHLPLDYGMELLGISRSTNASLGDIVLMNLLYDVTSFCTGIIGNDEAGGLWHGRNLDYGETTQQTDKLKMITVRVDFYKNGQFLYSAVSFAGYVGVLTAWKPQEFSITVNARDKGNLIFNLLSALRELYKGGVLFPVTMIARMSMESDSDFAASVLRLSSSQLIAPVYYIVSGNRTDQGIVLVRSQLSILGVNRLSQATGKWFIVQTNYDPWEAPPQSDDRRDPAIKAMNALGQSNLTMAGLFQVLSVPPVNNIHTVYTSVFSATRPDESITVIRV